MKNKELLPPPKLAFTKEQVEYITKAAKMMPYFIDIVSAYIYVPHDMLDKADDNLTVQHLRNKFGFMIQSTIDGKLKDVFDPVLSVASKDEQKSVASDIVDLPLKGQIWIDERDNSQWYFDAVVKDIFHIKFLHSLKNDTKLSSSSVRSLIVDGKLKREQRV